MNVAAVCVQSRSLESPPHFPFATPTATHAMLWMLGSGGFGWNEKVVQKGKEEKKKTKNAKPAAEYHAPSAKISQQSPSVQQHVYEAVTVFRPSLCQDCGKFSTGFSHQGQKCRSCEKIVCRECSRSPCSHCQESSAAVEAPGPVKLGGTAAAD